VASCVLGVASPPAVMPAGASTSAPSPAPAQPQNTAYWLAGGNGAVYAFGGAANDGSLPAMHIAPAKPVVGIASTPTGAGYWMDASDGGVFSFGAARFYGSVPGVLPPGVNLAAPIVGMASDPATGGYWLVASDGGIFSFHAPFFGSVPGIVPHITLRAPIVGMSAFPTGNGYWLVASDGGIFTFGAPGKFFGSTGAMTLNKPVVGMAPTATGNGYWLVASDGGIFSFGNASSHFYGSLGAQSLRYPIVGMTPLYSGTGYWLASATGAVTNFGQAVPWGETPSNIAAPIVGIATAVGNGDPGSTVYQAGSYGYDVSAYQCGTTLPQSHAIGIVEVEGWAFGAVNHCLAQQAAWASGGLSLYTFLSYGTSSTYQPGCASNGTAPNVAACNFGYLAAMSSYNAARSVLGTRVHVPWWFDVETANWTGTSAANRSVVVGAYDALHFTLGMNTVGFYFNLSGWNRLVGLYNPNAPLFPAWWGGGVTPSYKCSHARTVARQYGDVIPSGPVELVQFYGATLVSTGALDRDYAC